MHLRIKKILAGVLAAISIVTSSSISTLSTAFAEEYKYATSGTWGSDGKWVLSSDGTLTVTGTGVLGSSALTPKLQFVDDVKKLIVGEGITYIDCNFTGSDQLQRTNHLSEMVLPSTLSDLNFFSLNSNSLKDIYIYSKNVIVLETNKGMLPNPGSGTVMHLYKNSETENCFKKLYNYTDNDIVYINGERPEEPDPIPANVTELTDTSGPSGLNSKWEWNETSSTLTFSGKGPLSIGDDYKKYATKTKHIIIAEGIENIDAYTDLVIKNGIIVSRTFYGFTALKDVKLPDTLKEMGDCSFYQTPIIQIFLPEGLEKIGFGAFRNSNLEEISFPESLNKIGESAFSRTKIKSINLHSGMYIDGSAFSGCQSLKEVTIPKDITFYRTYEGGQGMARAHATFSNCTGLKKATIEDGSKITNTWGNVQSLNGLGENLFQGCTSLKTVIIGGNVDYIPVQTFDDCPSLSDMYFYTPDLSTIVAKGENDGQNESIDTTNDPTFYVIKGSKTEQTLKDAGYLTDDNVVYLATEDDINKLNETIEKTADTSKFTEDYTKKFTESVNSGKAILDKYKTDKFSGITLKEVNDVIDILDNPKYKPANYTSVDEAIAKADKLDLSKYTDESVKALQDAINAVEKGLDITNQDKVDAFAKAIEDAIKGLVVKKTDSKPNKPNNSGTSKNPNVKPATSVPITTRSPSQVAKDKKNAKKKINQAKITNLKAKSKSKKKITVSWKKVKKAVGYEVQVSKTRKFKKALFDKFTTKKKITFKKKLKSGKIYYVRVRAYATYKDAYGKPQKVYSKWIKKVRKVKVK